MVICDMLLMGTQVIDSHFCESITLSQVEATSFDLFHNSPLTSPVTGVRVTA